MKYIAEIGSNWRRTNDMTDNWLNIADTVKDLANIGTDYVKFQAWNTPDFIHQSHPDYKNFEKYQLPIKWYGDLIKLVEDHGLKFMVTPFDFETVERFQDLNVKYWKIASSDIIFHGLIKAVAEKATELYVSVGNASMDEIVNVNRMLINYFPSLPRTLLHCISRYPTQVEEIGFNRINELKRLNESRIPEPPFTLGWSSHVVPAQAADVATLATGMGVEVMEFHVYRPTHSKLKTPDVCVSLTVTELGELMTRVEGVETLMNSVPKFNISEMNWARRNPETGLRPTIDPTNY